MNTELDRIFLQFKLVHGHLAEMPDDVMSSRLSGWDNDELELPDEGTHFGFVFQGSATLETAATTFELQTGMYFVAPHSGRIRGSGQGIVITSLGYFGMFMLGGPIESAGRLRYIDGCTDSLLIPPPILGDPCLNALYFPTHISQTAHTHPSLRIGIVANGMGECHTAEATYSLFPGLAFIIQADKQHAFSTKDDEMVIIAFHPDSDFGPTDETHPMINRTIVRGVPASHIESIHTRQSKES
jgi:AraC-like ligand binding domain